MIHPELAKDLRNFVFAVHPYLHLPTPTALQYELCNVFQNDDERSLLMAFRGCSKSHLAALYAVWLLYKNANEKILVISATGDKAKKFVAFCKKVMEVCPFLQHMISSEKGLSHSFSIAGADPSQDHSLTAKGLTATITSARCSKCILDDVETSNNSMNSEARDKIEYLSAEVEDILLPDVPGKILVLGTPHSASSYLNRLEGKGYKVYKFPVFDEEGNSVEPTRFSNELLEKRRISKGDSLFALQYLLSTDLADVDRYPLKLSQLVISEEYSHKACKEEYIRTDIKHNVFVKEAKGSDAPLTSSSKGYEVPIIKTVLALDPSDGGDEFAYTVASTRNGYIFWNKGGAWNTGLNPAVLDDICSMIKKYNINELHVETNFGGSTMVQLLKQRVQIPIVEVRNTKQKEKRIISSLEPVLNQGKLVVNSKFLEDTTLMAQFCNITRAKGSLKQDDRLDSLEIAVAALNESLSTNLDRMKDLESQRRWDSTLESMMGSSRNSSWM